MAIYAKLLKATRFVAIQVVVMLVALLITSNVSGWTSIHWRDFCPAHLAATTVPLPVVFNQASVALAMGIATSAFMSAHAGGNNLMRRNFKTESTSPTRASPRCFSGRQQAPAI